MFRGIFTLCVSSHEGTHRDSDIYYTVCTYILYIVYVHICICKYITEALHVSSFELQLSFAGYRLFYRALLQKRPKIWRSLLIEAIPYAWMTHEWHINGTSIQCVAVGCSVLQCVAVCCSVLQCVAVCCSVLHINGTSIQGGEDP